MIVMILMDHVFCFPTCKCLWNHDCLNWPRNHPWYVLSGSWKWSSYKGPSECLKFSAESTQKAQSNAQTGSGSAVLKCRLTSGWERQVQEAESEWWLEAIYKKLGSDHGESPEAPLPFKDGCHQRKRFSSFCWWSYHKTIGKGLENHLSYTQQVQVVKRKMTSLEHTLGWRRQWLNDTGWNWTK